MFQIAGAYFVFYLKHVDLLSFLSYKILEDN